MKRSNVWVGGALVLAVAAIGLTLLRNEPTERREAPRRPSQDEWLRQTLFTLLKPVALSNCTLERFGEPHDGGYLLCANLLEAVQGGYSYGISGYDQWGCDVSRKLGVPVHQYDCFDTRQPACPEGDMRFHAECVGPAMVDEDGRLFDTMANQFTKNGDAAKRLVVKIDVEGAEWDSFVLAPDWVFERIDQLVVEFHGVASDRFVAAARRLARFFHVVHIHYNNYSCEPGLTPFPASAYEVLFVSKKLGVVDPSRPAGGPNPLDTPNNPNAPDCQIPIANR